MAAQIPAAAGGGLAEPQEARETRLKSLVPPLCLWHGSEPGPGPMSWRELERLVRDGEGRPEVRMGLRSCRNDVELLLRARQLGYRITRVDLQQAWQEHQLELEQQQALSQAADPSGGAGKGCRASC